MFKFRSTYFSLKNPALQDSYRFLVRIANLFRNYLSPYSYIEIETYLGFSSQIHLEKVFKKYTGMTMRQYIKNTNGTLAENGSRLCMCDVHSLVITIREYYKFSQFSLITVLFFF